MTQINSDYKSPTYQINTSRAESNPVPKEAKAPKEAPKAPARDTVEISENAASKADKPPIALPYSSPTPLAERMTGQPDDFPHADAINIAKLDVAI